MHATKSSSMARDLTCSIIGSFRQYYERVVDVIDLFETIGIHVLSPKRSSVVDPNEWFVRLQTDKPEFDPAQIQLIALHRILRSVFVYVVAPDGYVGKTTCYEIGRIHERNVPLYFSERPLDLPIAVASSSVIAPEELAAYVKREGALPPIECAEIPALIRQLERDLRSGPFVE